MDAVRTHRNASITVYTYVSLKHHFEFPFKALWIRTPLASERASLKKYQSPDAGAVECVILLHIKYDCLPFNIFIALRS